MECNEQRKENADKHSPYDLTRNARIAEERALADCTLFIL